jgi:general secretion pathway protein H
MRTSATAIQRGPSERGFTLLELLVVVAIVALIAALASLSLGVAGPQPAAAARRVADRLALEHEEAMLSGRTLGLRRSSAGLEFVALTLDTQSRSAVWTPLEDDRGLGTLQELVAPPFSFVLEVEGAAAAAAGAPAVVLLPDGDLTPFRLTVSAPGAPSVHLIGAEDGSLRIEGGER